MAKIDTRYCVYLRRADGKGTVLLHDESAMELARAKARFAFRTDKSITMIWVLQEPGNCTHLILTTDDRIEP